MATITKQQAQDAGDLTQQEAREILESVGTLDFSQYKTAAGAAKALYRALRVAAAMYGLNPRYVRIYKPSERQGDSGDGWWVVWEECPTGRWANSFCGYYEAKLVPGLEIEGHHDATNWFAEPYWGFDLIFWDD